MATWRPPAGFVALAVVAIAVGGIVNMVHEGQKKERQVRVPAALISHAIYSALYFLTLLFAALACASQVMRQAVYEDIKKLGR